MNKLDETLENSPPRWAREFPIQQQEETRVSRRGFIACLGIAGVLGTAAAVLANAAVEGAETSEESFDIGPASRLAPGESAPIQHPATGKTILLIHLSSGRYVAFDQRCTHLLCPVHYDAATKNILCPCHHGVFSAENGRPLAGPPRTPLHEFSVEVENDRLLLRRMTVR